jgi:hypothetical protein
VRRLACLPVLLTACASDPATSTTSTTGTTGTTIDDRATTSSTSTTGLAPTSTATTTRPIDPTYNSGTTTTDSAGDTSTSTGTTGDPDTSSTGADTTTGAPPDPCLDAVPTCPGAPPAQGGGGLVAIDRCGFPLHDQDTWAVQAARVDALRQVLPTVALAELAPAEFNRDAVAIANVPGGVKDVAQAFRWNADDNDGATWVPQGLTGTADASPDGMVAGRKLIVVSWYHESKGVRLSVVDIADPTKPVYRHILLVEPIAGDPITYQPIPIHAGGLAWFGDLLYVADTGKGFRVFDTTALMRVATDVDSVGWDAVAKVYRAGLYKFILPQIGAYVDQSACKPLFSSVALDRTSDPPSLVSSEYCNGTSACDEKFSGRIYRWPLDPGSHRLAGADLWPSEAHYMAQSHVQGGLASDGNFYLSSSAPAGVAGAQYVLPGGGPSKTRTWVDGPEDLMRDGALLWSLSEGTGSRVVFAVPLATL